MECRASFDNCPICRGTAIEDCERCKGYYDGLIKAHRICDKMWDLSESVNQETYRTILDCNESIIGEAQMGLKPILTEE